MAKRRESEISRLKQVEVALQESEGRLHAVLDNVVDGIITINEKRIVQSFNSAAEKIFGYSSDEVTGRNVKMLMPEPYHSQHDQYIGNYLRTGKAKIIGIGREVVGRRKDGSTFPLDLAVSEVRLGEECLFTGIIRDITQRRQAENELIESRERIHAIVDNVVDGIITINEKRIVQSFNSAAEKIFGYSSDEVTGRNVKMLMPEPYHSQHDQYIGNYLRTGKAKIIGIGREVVGRRKDGSTFPLDLAVSEVRLGRERLFTGIIRDITKRRQAEEQVRKLSHAVEQSPSVVMIADTDGNVQYVNPKFTQITGYAPEEIIGQNPRMMQSGEKSPEDYKELWDTITSGKEWRGEFHNKKKNGELYWEAASISPVKDAEGVTTNYIKVSEDVTKRKEAEENLQRTMEELARSNAELQQFAYVASHDLQEPLRMVSSYMQLLERRYKDKLDKDAGEFINYAVDGAAWMQKLIHALLEYSRVGTRGKALEPTDSSETFGLAVTNLKAAIEESGAEVTSGELPSVMADPIQLGQLFQNLISNALKFHGDKPPKVHVSAEVKGGMCQFSVQDNGIGIEPQYAERIFVIFQRLHGREEYPGTGIGLSVCKKIVERHGGRIWVESEPGKGATFYFTIPMVKG